MSPTQAPQNILALDTAYGVVAACLCVGDAVFHGGFDTEKPRSINLAEMLIQLLNKANLECRDLDAFAFGCGPGSFTGLRIGAATLAGLNSGLNLPIVHLSSLAITAAQTDAREIIHVIEDARAGETFYACYQGGKIVEDNCCIPWSALADKEPGAYVGHSDPAIDMPNWRRLRLSISRDKALAQVLRTHIKATTDWQGLPRYPQPAYMQVSQAERHAHG